MVFVETFFVPLLISLSGTPIAVTLHVIVQGEFTRINVVEGRRITDTVFEAQPQNQIFFGVRNVASVIEHIVLIFF